MSDPDKAPHWLVRPITIALLWWLFAIAVAVTIVVDTMTDRHSEFGLDGTLGFGAWFGFAACVVLVGVAKLVGLILKRRDDYYER